ncbi:MAG: hypothetical protein WA418_33585 [Bradyrhizobium sp.]
MLHVDAVCRRVGKSGCEAPERSHRMALTSPLAGTRQYPFVIRCDLLSDVRLAGLRRKGAGLRSGGM